MITVFTALSRHHGGQKEVEINGSYLKKIIYSKIYIIPYARLSEMNFKKKKNLNVHRSTSTLKIVCKCIIKTNIYLLVDLNSVEKMYIVIIEMILSINSKRLYNLLFASTV